MDKNNRGRNKPNDGDDKVRSRRGSRPAKKRVCEYCQAHIDRVDYKDADLYI